MDTETVAVSGNGTYTTPTGFTLPTTGTVAGHLPVGGHLQRRRQQRPASDSNAIAEQVTVSTGQPTLVTTASPTTSRWPHGPDCPDRHGGPVRRL